MIQAIKDELAANPAAYGALTDADVVPVIRAVSVATTKQYLTGSEIFNATDDAEYSALTATQKTSWDALCGIDSIDTSSGVARAREAELFGAGTITRSNLQAARAVTTYPFANVDEGHITRARNPK